MAQKVIHRTRPPIHGLGIGQALKKKTPQRFILADRHHRGELVNNLIFTKL